MSSVKATQLRPGMVIQHDGQLFTIFSVDHRTPGNKRGSMQTRMKNLKSGTMIDYRFRAEEFVDRAILDEVEFEYLYNEGDDFHFMNTKNYEQMQMSREELGESVYYLIPSTLVKVEFFEEKAIGVDLPDTMDMRVVQTEPTLQKATASAVMKPATLETGLVVQVPPFVNEGDRIKVDTSEARYVQRKPKLEEVERRPRPSRDAFCFFSMFSRRARHGFLAGGMRAKHAIEDGIHIAKLALQIE